MMRSSGARRWLRLDRRCCADWSTLPAVGVGRRSPAAVVEYLRRFDNGGLVDAIMTPPEIEGRVFYNEAMSGFNFVRNRLPIAAVAEQALRYGAFARARGGRAECADA